MPYANSGCWFASRGGDCRALIAWQQEFIAGAERAWEASKVMWNASVQYGSNAVSAGRDYLRDAGEALKSASQTVDRVIRSDCFQGVVKVTALTIGLVAAGTVLAPAALTFGQVFYAGILVDISAAYVAAGSSAIVVVGANQRIMNGSITMIQSGANGARQFGTCFR